MFFPLDNATVSVNGYIDWNQNDALYWAENVDRNTEIKASEFTIFKA
jgi:hypothetical protein